jgi:hypothetical protein
VVSYHRTRGRRSALAHGSRSTTAAEDTSTASYTTSGDATSHDNQCLPEPLMVRGEVRSLEASAEAQCGIDSHFQPPPRAEPTARAATTLRRTIQG